MEMRAEDSNGNTHQQDTKTPLESISISLTTSQTIETALELRIHPGIESVLVNSAGFNLHQMN
jgi:hypothetical protein